MKIGVIYEIKPSPTILFFLTKYLTLLIIVLLAVYKVLRRNTGGNKTFNNVMQGLSDAIGA